MEKGLTDNKIDQISSILREDVVAIHNKRRIANKLGLNSGLFEDIMSSSNGDSYETFYKILQEFRGKNDEANVYHITNALTELTLIHAAAKVDELQLSDPESDKKNSKQSSKSCTESEQNLNLIIGIDLGTTYSTVGVYLNGHVEIIPNDTSTLLPSYVSFRRNSLDYVVGYNAKNSLSNNPTNTVYACKRFIGKSIDEADLKESKKRWLFNVVNVEGKAMIELNFPSGFVYKSPEEISALILKELKNKAEAYLETVVRNVVITVPANFNDSERSVTKRAAQIAGLTVIRMINEPTAAALAYGIHCKSKEESFEGRNILVYDLGGGTFDVSVLSVDLNIEFEVGNEPSSAFIVLATKGDMNLGGEDFDYLLLNHLLRKFNFDSSEMISNNEMSMLREASENVKINLSVSEEEIVSITLGGKLYMTKVSRTEFEEICMPKFKRTIEVLNNILVEQDLTPKHIQEVIFIGGSTRIPKIRELVREYLNSNPKVVYNDSINPDEAVSTGAAILGGMLYKSISDFELTDIIFSSIGTSTVGNVMCKMIDKYSQVPTAKSKVFTTIFRGQPSINVRIYEGESEDANENNYLGHFILDGLESIEEPQILITFKVDFDGILHVTAEDKKSGKKNKIDIVRDFAKSENVPR